MEDRSKICKSSRSCRNSEYRSKKFINRRRNFIRIEGEPACWVWKDPDA